MVILVCGAAITNASSLSAIHDAIVPFMNISHWSEAHAWCEYRKCMQEVFECLNISPRIDKKVGSGIADNLLIHRLIHSS